MAVSALLVALLTSGCDSRQPEQTIGPLTPGTPVAADLCGDGSPEQVYLEADTMALVVTDGEVTYRSRDRWHLAKAFLADTDSDSLTEVVALVDSEKGRHLAVFGYSGGAFRERFVSKAIVPAPVDIEVAPGLVVLIQQTAGEDGRSRTYLRWNGFGYTARGG